MNPLINSMGSSGNLMSMISAVKNGNPDAIANTLMQTNPNFKRFYEANKGKSVDQICRENGLDTSIIKSFLK